MLELQRLLTEYKARGRDARDAPVFDDAQFRRGQYSDGAVLKFRGIVRDVFDPELVLLSDAADVEAAPRVDELTGDNFVERVPLKVALVPYVSDWAAQRYHSTTATATAVEATAAPADATSAKGTKRTNDALAEEETDQRGVQVSDVDSEGVKKVRPAGSADDAATSSDPQPAFSEAVVTIYVYDGQYGDGLGVDAFKVNESFEFTGVLDLMVLSAGPAAVSYDDGFTAQSIAELTISDCLEGIQRKQQSSVVLHCCDAMKLDATHFVQPHAPQIAHASLQTNAARRDLLTSEWKALAEVADISVVRKALVEHLSHAIGSDELAAEYVLLCLLSRVYSRPDNATVLGNLSVNLSFEKNVPASVMSSSIDRVAKTLQAVVPMLASVDMSIASLNEAKFLPHKDYENDVLRGGVLQFAHGTTLLVNETVLSAGNLNEQGVKNVGALQSLVEKMLLPYDFQYYSMDFPQDVAVLSLSQGKSILPVHVSIPIELNNASSAVPTSDAMIECFRLYLAVLRSLEVGLGNEQAEIAEKHFVACRKAKQEVTAEDLHRWLRLARLMALSHGADSVSAEFWQQMLDLENRRITRIDGLAETAN